MLLRRWQLPWRWALLRSQAASRWWWCRQHKAGTRWRRTPERPRVRLAASWGSWPGWRTARWSEPLREGRDKIRWRVPPHTESVDSEASRRTDDGSGGVDDGAGDLRGVLPTGAEEELDGEGLTEGPVLHLHGVLISALAAAHGHFLTFHQLHQFLRLAGWVQRAWLVPAGMRHE